MTGRRSCPGSESGATSTPPSAKANDTEGNAPAVVRDLQAEMRDRAATFASYGD